ncbi:hypothetical protein [Cupriavidus necator]
MAQRNDQVFQLSLTEIAFTVSFLLLLLLGYLVFKEQNERLAAQADLAKVQTAQQAAAALDAARSSLANALQGAGVSSPDEVITKLISADQARAERDRLKQQVEDLDAKLTALTELKEELERAAKASRPGVTQAEVMSALALQEQVRTAIEQASAASSAKPTTTLSSSGVRAAAAVEGKTASERASRDKGAMDIVRQAIATTAELRRQLKDKLDRDLKIGQEAQTVQEVVAAAKGFGDLAKGGQSPEAIKKENSDLRGQVAFLKNRLDARGGRDFPPCWADESGKVEFLFAVEVRPESVVIAPAWPSRRESAAKALPGIDGALAGPHSYQAFASKIQGVFNWSKAQDPECRHYVQLKSSISDAVQSDRARLMVENYFYKVEARR